MNTQPRTQPVRTDKDPVRKERDKGVAAPVGFLWQMAGLRAGRRMGSLILELRRELPTPFTHLIALRFGPNLMGFGIRNLGGTPEGHSGGDQAAETATRDLACLGKGSSAIVGSHSGPGRVILGRVAACAPPSGVLIMWRVRAGTVA